MQQQWIVRARRQLVSELGSFRDRNWRNVWNRCTANRLADRCPGSDWPRPDACDPESDGPTGKIAIYTGSGEKAAIDAQMTSGLANAGYTKVSSSAPAASVSISSWKKGGTTVGLNINSAGGNVTCSVSVNPVG